MRLPEHERENIEKEVACLLRDYGVNSYPIDIFQLLHQLGVRVIPYSSMMDECRQVALSQSLEGFKARGANRDYMVCYNDSRPANRIRFTLAHELGHIWLEHKHGTPEEEAQANYFAGYLLSPHPLLALSIRENEWATLAALYGVSTDCMNVSLSQLCQRFQAFTCFKNYEVWILQNCHLNEHSHLQETGTSAPEGVGMRFQVLSCGTSTDNPTSATSIPAVKTGALRSAQTHQRPPLFKTTKQVETVKRKETAWCQE